MINISELIDDPDFSSPNGITIRRNKVNTINHKQNIVTSYINIAAVIIVNDPTTVEMLPASDRSTESITIYTHEKLYTTGKDDYGDSYISDIAIYKGIFYKIENCMDKSEYGYCKSTASKTSQGVM